MGYRNGMINRSMVMLGGSFGTAALGAVQGIIISRFIGPEGTGQFYMAISICITVVTFLIFGLSQSNIYFLNHHRVSVEQIIVNSIVFSLVLGALSSIGVYLLFTFGREFTGQFSLWVRTIFSIGILFLFMRSVVRPILIARMHVVQYNASQILVIGFMVLALASLAYFGSITAGSALVVYSGAQVVGAFIIIYFLRAHISLRLMPDIRLFWRTLKYGFQLHMVNLLLILDLNISMIFIGLLMPGEFAELGFYSRAVAICGLIRFIPSSFSSLLYSHWAQIDDERKVRQLERVLRVCLILGIVILGIIALLGKEIIILLYGKVFTPAYAPLMFLAFQQVFWMLSKVFQSMFSASGKAMFSTYSLSVANALSILGLVFMIPRFGITGAAATVAVSQLVCVIINIALAKRQFNISILDSMRVTTDDVRYLMQEMRWKRKK